MGRQRRWGSMADKQQETQQDRGYGRLEVYHKAHALGVAIHSLSLRLPRHEFHETGSQLRKASKSISANIVEGYGRRQYRAEFVRFLTFALASCDETAEWLRYVQYCHPVLAPEVAAVADQAAEVGRNLNRLIQAVERGHQVRKPPATGT